MFRTVFFSFCIFSCSKSHKNERKKTFMWHVKWSIPMANGKTFVVIHSCESASWEMLQIYHCHSNQIAMESSHAVFCFCPFSFCVFFFRFFCEWNSYCFRMCAIMFRPEFSKHKIKEIWKTKFSSNALGLCCLTHTQKCVRQCAFFFFLKTRPSKSVFFFFFLLVVNEKR